MEGLTEGRIVHWVDQDGLCNAAIVISAQPWTEPVVADLQVFRRSGEMTHIIEAAYRGPSGARVKPIGTWHWPERA